MNEQSQYFVNASQIRAARALLDWSQEELAAQTGLSIATIRKIESGHISPRGKTMESIYKALEQARIEFVPPMGVNLRSNELTLIEGEHAYTDLTRDIFNTLKNKGGPVLFMYADNSMTFQEEIDLQIQIRRNGGRFQFLVEEGNTYMHYPLQEYRWIPKKFFINNLQVIYGNKVATCLYKGRASPQMYKVVVIDSKMHAEALKNTFDFMWENCRKPTFSTAPTIYD